MVYDKTKKQEKKDSIDEHVRSSEFHALMVEIREQLEIIAENTKK